MADICCSYLQEAPEKPAAGDRVELHFVLADSASCPMQTSFPVILVIRHRLASFTCCCNHLKTGFTRDTLVELGQRGTGLVHLGQRVIELQWYLGYRCYYERVIGSNQTFEAGDR